MSDASLDKLETASLLAQRRVDALCLGFEEAWKTGHAPCLEGYLTDAVPADRAALLRELLALELAYRGRQSDRPQLDDYQHRFPEYAAVIRSVFRKWTGISPLDSDPPANRKTSSSDPASSVDQTRETPTAAPEWIGKYRIVERLGSGGQAEVFRAIHPHLSGRDVVIKWARQTLGPAQRQALVAEGQTLARLDDPSFVRIYDVDVHQGRPFVVMEYLAGRSLQQEIKNARPAPHQAAAMVAQLAHALIRIHQEGICHRDIKPANIVIDGAGPPRLVDFGLARTEYYWDQSDASQGEVSGTFQYMSPEQANAETDHIGPQTDVFGLGAVLYALLTGRPPYQGTAARDAWLQARRGLVTPPRLLNPRIPKALQRICLKALARDLEDRYASACELEAALRRYLRRRQARVLVRRAVVAGAALALALLLGIGVWSRINNKGQAPATSSDLIVLEQMRFFVRRNNDDSAIFYHDLVANGLVNLEPDPISPPLGLDDDFKLQGRFAQPTYWYVVLIDTKGEVEVPAASEERQTDVEFPVRKDKMASFDPRDPAGTNVLLLLAGPVPSGEGTPVIKKMLRSVDKPPRTIPRRWSGTIRGVIEKDADPDLFLSDYLRSIQLHLPDGFQPAYVVFVPTRR
jgi:serine/threonine protein kinase